MDEKGGIAPGLSHIFRAHKKRTTLKKSVRFPLDCACNLGGGVVY